MPHTRDHRATLSSESAASDAHRRNNSLRVNVAAAQSGTTLLAQSGGPSDSFPVLALIPATPSLPASPFRVPDLTALFPNRVPFDRASILRHAGLLDVFDPDAWTALRDVVVSPDIWKIAFLSLMFVFQANAQYVASGNLSVPLFQLAYQLKVRSHLVASKSGH